MGESSAQALEKKWIGRIIADQYRVDWVLGVGGMGLVVSAEDMKLQRWSWSAPTT